MSRAKRYTATHPWLTFELHLEHAPVRMWTMLGECRSKCEHLRNTPLRPETSEQLRRIYLAKGVQGTAAIEGNTLTEEQVQEAISGELEVPPSREYQKQDINNILEICEDIAHRVLNENRGDLSWEQIREVHRRLFKDLEVEDHNPPGEIPTVDIGVGRYRGAPREDCEFLVKKMIDWIDSEWSRASPDADRWVDSICAAIIKAVIAHLYFVWIHPFGDGNGRTARFLELQILLRAGVPWPATQLLSNHYNLTRDRYYRELRKSSESGGDVVPFLLYAIEGFRDQLVEQLQFVTEQQHRIFWRDYVYRIFRDEPGEAADRRRQLALEISRRDALISRAEIRVASAELALLYVDLDDKTISRDLADLEKRGLIKRSADGYEANSDLLLPFLPPGVPEEE